jgi:flagellar basal-body rod protein FlgC
MSMLSIFQVSSSAISAQSQRLNVVASNLANADAVAGPDGQSYKARQVMFQSIPMGSDANVGVQVSNIVQSN